MHDIKQGDEQLPFCSLHLVYQSDRHNKTNRTTDVHLQDEQISADYDYKCDYVERNNLELYSDKQIIDYPATYSLPTWTMTPRNVVCGSPPFVPYSHKCRYISSQKESEATADGKQVLMEMIEETSKSEYPYEELSFKEFVREQRSMEEPRQKEVIKEDNRNCKSKIKKEKKNRNSKMNILSRSESTDRERFQLKVFLPVFLGSKMPKVSSTKSPTRTAGSDVNTTSTCTNQIMDSTDIISSTKISKSRSAKSNSIPGRWSLSSGKCKPSRQRGCLFI